MLHYPYHTKEGPHDVSTRNITLTAMLTALLCIVGPLTLALGPIPLSLTTAVLMLTALLMPPGSAVLCCVLYLLMGLIGLPVFSGFTGGLGALAGPTGGFLLGYLPLTALCSVLSQRTGKRGWHALIFAAGTLILYAMGTAWYAWQTASSLPAAAAVCVLPFLPGDAIKIIAVVHGGNAVKTRLKKAGLLR